MLFCITWKTAIWTQYKAQSPYFDVITTIGQEASRQTEAGDEVVRSVARQDP